MTGRTCGKCGRTGEAPVIPIDASPELALCLKFAAGNCLWCHDLNLLAGGYDVPRLHERWTEDEFHQLTAEADRLRDQRLAHWRQARLMRERARAEKTQQVIAA